MILLESAADYFGGNFTLSADVQIKSFNNAKGRACWLSSTKRRKERLALVLVNNAMQIAWQLVTVDQPGRAPY